MYNYSATWYSFSYTGRSSGTTTSILPQTTPTPFYFKLFDQLIVVYVTIFKRVILNLIAR